MKTYGNLKNLRKSMEVHENFRKSMKRYSISSKIKSLTSEEEICIDDFSREELLEMISIF